MSPRYNTQVVVNILNYHPQRYCINLGKEYKEKLDRISMELDLNPDKIVESFIDALDVNLHAISNSLKKGKISEDEVSRRLIILLDYGYIMDNLMII